jgi:hypothetical protein
MASSTLNTAKAKDFESMTMRDEHKQFRPLSVVPGIGPKAEEKLAEFGYSTIAHLVGQYLLFGCDNDLMTSWFEEKIPGHPKRYIEASVQALSNWCATML